MADAGAAGRFQNQQIGGIIVTSRTQFAAKTNVGSVQVTIATNAVKADSLIFLTPFALGPVGSSGVTFAVTSINPGTNFILSAISSIAMTTVSYQVGWMIVNQT